MRVKCRIMDTAKLETVDDLFAAFGGPTTVARALNLRGASTASEMRRRQSIPVGYWRHLIEIAPDFGVVGLTLEKLVAMHSSPISPSDAAPEPERAA
jgi:hypothetical protein